MIKHTIDKARELLEGISDDPWEVIETYLIFSKSDCDNENAGSIAEVGRTLDARFIAAAPDLVRSLLQALEETLEENEKLREANFELQSELSVNALCEERAATLKEAG